MSRKNFYGKVLYSQATDPKMLMLRRDATDAAVAVWFSAWCMAGNCHAEGKLITNGVPVTLEEFAALGNFETSFTEKCFASMVRRGLMQFDGEVYTMMNWDNEETKDRGKEGVNERKRRSRERLAAIARGETVEPVQPLFPAKSIPQVAPTAEPQQETASVAEQPKPKRLAKVIQIDSFEEFYAAYPRKVGRGQAEKAYRTALKSTTHEEIMQGLNAQIPKLNRTGQQYRPHPATWLNGRRWEDETGIPNDPNNDGGGNVSAASWY